MQVQLNEAELEVAVTLYLSSQGMNLKNKELTFSFEGECSMDIEPASTEDTTATTSKPKQTRKKVVAKKEEPKAPVVEPEYDEYRIDTVTVEEVVETLEEQTKPVEVEPEDLFPEPKAVEVKPSNENSIFG